MKKVIRIANILLILAMMIHVTIAMVLHSQHPEYSAPASIEIINAIFYLTPLLIINIVCIFANKLSKNKNKTSKEL